MSLRQLHILVVSAALLFAAGSASHADERATAEGVAYFEKHIRPLLANRCYSCHSSRAKKREGGLLLDRREGWSEGGDNGVAIVPGDANASLLIQAVRYANADLQMPPDKSLSKEEISRLERWVEIGAPDPRDDSEIEKLARDDPSDPIAGREHWAFRPLSETPLPHIAANDWPNSAIDAYTLASLEAASLRPAPAADRRTLVRRVYLQLVGLPPTPEQVATFLADDRPDVLERLVDSLLNSPQFGERWGRHWLDLARYADSNGLDENFLFREAWRYRNWVIDAVNADMPFDRYVLEQIAGDLLPYDSIEQRDRQRIAAGFLVVGPKVLLGNNDMERRMDVADEQIDTIGKTILGQTLGCARCHDHKFDPVPTADYYALAGIMTSTEVMERRYMLGQQRLMERLVGLGSDGDKSDGAYEKYWREHKTLQANQKRAATALELLKKGDEAGLVALAKQHADAIADAALETSRTAAERIKAQEALVAERTAAATPPSIPPRAMIPRDVEAPADEAIRLAGQFDRLGEKVPRGFLRVVSNAPTEISKGQSGRIELGRWLTDTNIGAGHVAARVLANRIWHHLIGRGIVRTVDNFGRTGEAPSHPELLDYLAGQLVESNWSIKALVRKIVLSQTFCMSSRHDQASHAADPENRLLWRAHRRRLDPEALRDSMRRAAGTLDLKPMDSSVWYLGDQATAVGDNKNRRRTDFPCRSVYLPVIRNDLPELFDVFDFADPHTTTGMRSQTMVATQGLFILNDDSVMAAAEALARSLLTLEASHDQESLIDQMFERILNAQPTTDERAALLSFILQTETRLTSTGEKDAKVQAWSMACHALFASSRFQIVE